MVYHTDELRLESNSGLWSFSDLDDCEVVVIGCYVKLKRTFGPLG